MTVVTNTNLIKMPSLSEALRTLVLAETQYRRQAIKASGTTTN